jgi:hypothetical protein
VAMRPQVIIQKRQIYKSRADMLNRSWVLFCDVRPATLFQPVAKKDVQIIFNRRLKALNVKNHDNQVEF